MELFAEQSRSPGLGQGCQPGGGAGIQCQEGRGQKGRDQPMRNGREGSGCGPWVSPGVGGFPGPGREPPGEGWKAAPSSDHSTDQTQFLLWEVGLSPWHRLAALVIHDGPSTAVLGLNSFFFKKYHR